METNKDYNKIYESNNIFDNTKLTIVEKNEILDESIFNEKIELKKEDLLNVIEIKESEKESEFDTNYEQLNIPKDFPINLNNIELKKEKTEKEILELSNTKVFINKVSNLFSNLYSKTTISLSENLEKKKKKEEINISNNKKTLKSNLNKKVINNNNNFKDELNLEQFKNDDFFIKDGIIFIKDNILSLKKLKKEFPINTLIYRICDKQFIIKGEDWWVAIPKNKDLLDIEFEKFELINTKDGENEQI